MKIRAKYVPLPRFCHTLRSDSCRRNGSKYLWCGSRAVLTQLGGATIYVENNYLIGEKYGREEIYYL